MQVTDQSIQNDVYDFEGIALVDFWAEWCTPCKMLEPIMDELKEQLKADKKVKILSLDVDSNPQTAQKYGVMSIPTIIVFKNGTPVSSLVGVRSKDDYLEAIAKAQE